MVLIIFIYFKNTYNVNQCIIVLVILHLTCHKKKILHLSCVWLKVDAVSVRKASTENPTHIISIEQIPTQSLILAFFFGPNLLS